MKSEYHLVEIYIKRMILLKYIKI